MKLEYILNEIKNGNELYISNHLHCWKINKKTINKFNKLNNPVLIEKNDGLYMASGNKYVSIKYCKLEFLNKLNPIIQVCPNCGKIDSYSGDNHLCFDYQKHIENKECQ